MIDWLKRDPTLPHTVDLGDRLLPVAIRTHPRARRMTLRLAPDGSEARVSIPHWCSTREAMDFAQSRADWLARHLANVPAPARLADGSSLPYRGAAHRIAHDRQAARRVFIEGTTIRVGGPAESLANRLARFLQREARGLLAEDLAHYCDRANLPVPPLALSSAQRRWGSCATRGAIRINWRLVMAPDAVRRSVVAHEVAHLVHFDHSPAFHAALRQIYDGDIREADLWLKREGRSLYVPFG